MNPKHTAIIDPQWEFGTLSIGDNKLPFLTLHHPVHGQITILPSGTTLRAISDWINGEKKVTQ